MVDYAKKKNDELAALCKERGLAHTGKKADLVKRLEEHDKSSSAGKPAAPAEDEIDWDEEPVAETANAATSEAASNAIAAGGAGQVPNPQAVPNQQAAIDPTATTDLTVAAEPAAAADGAENTDTAASTEATEEKDFSTGLAERTLREEIERRKARARKFGTQEDSDDIKNLERALRFGTTDLPGLLNKALPEKQDRKGGNASEADGGIRKRNRGGRPGPGRRQGRNGAGGGGGGGNTQKQSRNAEGYPGWMTEKDRKAAELRKNRFQGSAAAAS